MFIPLVPKPAGTRKEKTAETAIVRSKSAEHGAFIGDALIAVGDEADGCPFTVLAETSGIGFPSAVLWSIRSICLYTDIIV
jgi:hypothetical protein